MTHLDPELRRRMLAYYDERAPEYEEAYTLGTGTASITEPALFKAESLLLAGIVGQIVRGRMMDLACGTAYWLPHYARQCDHTTLFDQSHNMLAEARRKATRLGVVDRCDFIQGDFFDQEFGEHSYDTVLVGFFLSHLTEAQEMGLFEALRTMLKADGRFLILDSAWSVERAKFNRKIERQARQLNDGTAFDIYKRYCDRDDISGWTAAYGVTLRIEHFGQAFYAVSGVFRH